MPHHQYRQSGQFKIYSRIVRSCFSLSEDERLVLLFVLDRSVERGNSFATISLKEFESGIVRKSAGRRYVVVQGTGLPPERIIGAINALREIGAIQASGNGSTISCGINDDWLHSELPQQGKWAIWGLTERDYEYRDGEDE